MKKHIVTVICFILTAFLVFAAMPYRYFEISAIDTSKSNEEALKSELAEYQQQQKELKKKLDSKKSDIEAKENEKQYLDSLVLATENEIEISNQLLKEYTEKIAQKEKEIKKAEQDVEDKYAELLGRMSFVYEEQGTDNYLAMILESESVSDMLMTVERIGSMLDFDNTLMSELTALLESLKSEKQALIETKTQQEELKALLEDKEKELEGQKKEVETYITSLEADEAALQAEYDKAKEAEKAADAEIEKLLAARAAQEAAAKAGGSPVFTGGNFIWPAPGAYRTVSSGYGWRVIFGRNDFHLGIDIPVPYGTNIFASSAGTVVTATWHYSYGYYVLIDHGNGSATLYAHNSKLLVSPGDYVEQGDAIAKAGSTGTSTGNHCHFEVRINGATQNPLSYVKQP